MIHRRARSKLASEHAIKLESWQAIRGNPNIRATRGKSTEWGYTERVRILRETLLFRVNRPVGLLEARYLFEVFRVVRDEDEIVGDGAGCYDQVEIVYR